MNPTEFQALASFRFLLRKFLRFSKDVLRAEQMTPDQYQTLLAIRAASSDGQLSIRQLAEQLQVKHHSTVGLVDQLVSREVIVREVAADDRRKILLRLTAKGDGLLNRLAPLHRGELCRLRAEMIKALENLAS